MECKSKTFTIYAPNAPSELIDTLWNVNYQYGNCGCNTGCELIDTLWNVNRELEQILGKWKPN